MSVSIRGGERKLSRRITNEISAAISEFSNKSKVEVKVPKKKPKQPTSEVKSNITIREVPQRVFLYLKILNIENVPDLVDEHNVMVRMSHDKASITRIEDYYSKINDVKITPNMIEMPTYSIRIDQDSVDELNVFSDSPLIITLFEYVPAGEIIRSSKLSGSLQDEDEETYERASEETWIPLAQGNLDLLQFFCQNKNMSIANIFLYPITMTRQPMAIPTCKLAMQIYSILPMLRNLTFCNMIFVTLESIYNTPLEMLNSEINDLIVNLSFQSKILNDKQEYDKELICSYSLLTKNIISEQNVNHKWESMKQPGVANTLGAYCGISLCLHKLFRGLLGTSGVDFKFNEIVQDEEYALTANAVHRFVLTKELSDILENVIAFNEHHIVVEIYNENEPDKILLEGTCDLSVFLYPQVNACRFAVKLAPLGSQNQILNFKTKGAAETSDSGAKGKKSKKINTDMGSNRSPSERLSQQKTIFAIINICLLMPITEVAQPLSKFNEKLDKKETLKLCKSMKFEPNRDKQLGRLRDEAYKEIDEIVIELIDYIVKNNIKYPLDAKNYFCCHLGNMVNKIIRLIASDFNIRTPTKTNIEFVNLITTVYKELEQRWYNIIQGCDDSKLKQCFISDDEKRWKIIKAMDIVKLTCEIGQETLGNFILQKIKKKNPENAELNFYLLIYNMEKQNYEAAREYFEKPLKEKLSDCEYFEEIIEIYIKYVEQQKNEETARNAFECLLEMIRDFLKKYPKETDFWILLHSLYANCSYLPGMEFTRWKYENLYEAARKELPPLPKSRWSIYNNFKSTLITMKGNKFYEAIELFLSLGLFQFAEVVFNQISGECLDPDIYFMITTFGIFQNTLPVKFASKQFPADKLLRGDEIRAFQYLVNGNLENYRGNTAAAMNNYKKLIEVKLVPSCDDFQLGLLHLGYFMLEKEENYLLASKAFQKFQEHDSDCLPASFGLGRTMYKLGRLEAALESFANATRYSMHIPDVWGYLALINLKLGDNFKALECWKYAKVDPQNVIGNEVLEELRNINPSDVFMYVDIPDNK